MKITLNGYNQLLEELGKKKLALAEINTKTYEKDNIEDMGFPYNSSLVESDNACRRIRREINDLEDVIHSAEIVESLVESETAANIDDTILVSMIYNGKEPEEESFILKERLGDNEVQVNAEITRVTISSPIGGALLGCEIGDTKTVKIPAGTLVMQVLDITKERGRR